jgi:hypothetical protein
MTSKQECRLLSGIFLTGFLVAPGVWETVVLMALCVYFTWKAGK